MYPFLGQITVDMIHCFILFVFEAKGAKEMSAKLEEIIYGKTVDWDFLKRSVDTLIKGIEEAYKPKRLRIEIRKEEEFGVNLSGETIFEMIDKEFEENKEKLNLDLCHMWKINEDVIIIGVKL